MSQEPEDPVTDKSTARAQEKTDEVVDSPVILPPLQRDGISWFGDRQGQGSSLVNNAASEALITTLPQTPDSEARGLMSLVTNEKAVSPNAPEQVSSDKVPL
jgi:hypothetical protein